MQEDDEEESWFNDSVDFADFDAGEPIPAKQSNKRQPLRITTAHNSPIRSKPDRPHPTVQLAAKVAAPKATLPKQPPPSKAASAKTAIEYAWSKDVRKALKQRFQMQNFRKNQLEAINATLSGKDCFVLLPTGKSSFHMCASGSN